MVLTERAGSSARKWLEELAAAHGGYQAVQQRAGMGENWPARAARGAVPTRSTVLRLAEVFGVQSECVDEILRDVDAFRRAEMSPASVERVTVVCPDCYTEVLLPPWRLKHRRVPVTKGRDGRLYGRCHPCASRRTVAIARTERFYGLAVASGERIKRRGKPETPGDQALAAKLAKEGFHLDQAWWVAEAASTADAEAKAIVNLLADEQILRSRGNGDIEKGRAIRDNSIRSAVHAGSTSPRRALN